MVALLVAFAAPAMANGNDDNGNDARHLDRNDINDFRFDNFNDRNDFDFADDGFFFSPFVSDEDLADELCSPLNSDDINDLVPGCIFGNNNDFNGNDVFETDFNDFNDNGFNNHDGIFEG
jgi:hypothetical protein